VKSKKLQWAEHVALTGETRNTYRILENKPTGEWSFGRLRRWKSIIKIMGMGDPKKWFMTVSNGEFRYDHC
jgi:hypothetical protein